MNLYMNLLTNTTAAGTNQQATGGIAGWFMANFSWIFMIGLLVLMYFIMIRPQQKKQKEEQKMRNNLRVGDELTTIGGIKGRVVAIKDDTVTIETSNDRTKIVFEKAAIGTVHTKHEDPIDDDDDDDDDI